MAHTIKLLCVLLFLVALGSTEANVREYQWHRSGVGSPLRHHHDFERVGGACPENQVVSGLRFARGGCYRPSRWEDGHILPKCDNEHDLEHNEGLYLDLDCQSAGTTLSDYQWISTGVGAPLEDHASFARLGATCPTGTVVTGVRFSRGGCGIDATWTLERKADMCQVPDDSREGLYLELRCAKLANADKASFSWYEAGIGAPLMRHADFEKVGGHCRPSEIVAGITFNRAGCHVHASWDGNQLNSITLPPCPAGTKDLESKEGLVVSLRCGIVEKSVDSTEPTAPATPTPHNPPVSSIPTGQPEFMTAHIPFDSSLPFHPIDTELFVQQVCNSLQLPTSYASVITQVEQSRYGKVMLSFQIYSNPLVSTSSGNLLISMVAQHDKALRGTYLGIPNARVEFSSLLGPEPPAPTPATPEPAAPIPATPEPAAPIPATPEPAAPIPATPEPAAPIPATPEPAAPIPATPEPAAPIPTVPVPAVPVPVAPVPAQTSSSQEDNDGIEISIGLFVDNGVTHHAPPPNHLSDLEITSIVLSTVVVGIILVALILFVYYRKVVSQQNDNGSELSESFISAQQSDEEGGIGYIMHQPSQPQIFWNGSQYVSIVQQ